MGAAMAARRIARLYRISLYQVAELDQQRKRKTSFSTGINNLGTQLGIVSWNRRIFFGTEEQGLIGERLASNA